MLCKIQLVPIVRVLSFLKINANEIVSTIMDLYTGAKPKKYNNMFKEIFFTFCDVLVLNVFLISHCALRLRILLWSPGEGMTRRPEFLLLSNPS
jgi:hypothetical protein